ncbi:MAG TPA: PepSY domain-containing protein [Marinobacterium sp.]|nr:PepSY domain-containing protein [Marinobacterium sp.]
MINSQCAALIALISLALTPLSHAAEQTVVAPRETVVEEQKPQVEVPLEEAAEGVEATPADAEEMPAKVQLPFDLKAAAEIALAAFGGEVLKAEQVEEETGTHFHIRVVNNGRVRDVVVDAANGEIIKPLDRDTVQAETSQNDKSEVNAEPEDAEVSSEEESTAQ